MTSNSNGKYPSTRPKTFLSIHIKVLYKTTDQPPFPPTHTYKKYGEVAGTDHQLCFSEKPVTLKTSDLFH